MGLIPTEVLEFDLYAGVIGLNYNEAEPKLCSGVFLPAPSKFPKPDDTANNANSTSFTQKDFVDSFTCDIYSLKDTPK